MGKRAQRKRRLARNLYRRVVDGIPQFRVGRTGTWYVDGFKLKKRAATAPLYFAYGSNLNVKQMARRCPTAVPFSRLNLPNWKLTFRGVADIVPSPGDTVYGALWEITALDEYHLDIYEGVSSGMYLKDYFDVSYTDKATGEPVTRKVLVYVMNDTRSESRPWKGYLDTIREGYQDFGIEEASLDAAVEAIPERKWERTWDYGAGYGRADWWNEVYDDAQPRRTTRRKEKDDGEDDYGFEKAYPKKEPDAQEWDALWDEDYEDDFTRWARGHNQSDASRRAKREDRFDDIDDDWDEYIPPEASVSRRRA